MLEATSADSSSDGGSHETKAMDKARKREKQKKNLPPLKIKFRKGLSMIEETFDSQMETPMHSGETQVQGFPSIVSKRLEESVNGATPSKNGVQLLAERRLSKRSSKK